ncbi:pre-mRNA-splicing factor SYF1-like [Ananas comosus]|uniref:Pre-mRNA-splicing factor SYF1 n=1 Tax=Ananas comosus TaxID=4615 RepID=A0A199VFS8_ANACO|nr:pre-mRNA-splicing factor SYF1-like [Ananas comosus]OAY75964.1 Pre-mRNA-splicing factor SYF1 [Ananas comosus]
MLLYPSESDFPYEEEVLREPLKLQAWRRYLAALAGAPPQKRFSIYERALRALPGSYKLWRGYLAELLDAARPLPISDPSYAALNGAFERALATMHRMPRIWQMYLASLTAQRRVTRARRTFDRALRSLPVSQHARLWPLYLRLVSLPGVPLETAVRVHCRYLVFDPSHLEDFIKLLLRSSRWQEAVTRLAAALNDDDKPFCSVKGKTRRQLWLDLCDIVASHAAEISTTGLNVEAVIRNGIRQFPDEKGLLWTSLADYYARRGLFAKARDVFEDGLNAVSTARDFGLIFEAYAQFEQLLLAAKLDASDGEVDNGNLNDGEFWLKGGDDTDFLIARIELLFDRRPKLLNCVLLRQNPHNVEQWRRRAKLFDGEPSTQVSTYVQALKTVDPMKAVGKPYTLWVDFARMYESRNLLDSAEEVFERATQVNFKSVDHLATVWCEWAEMELRHNNFEKALQLMRQATAEPSVEVKKRAAADGNEPVQMKLHKSLRVWSAYVDLEESLGSVESTRDVYDRMLDLKIATPQIILNYASFLEEHKYFEDAFKIYERGVKLFKYPHVREIWAMYLTKFVKRYGNTKLDRARDLFECAIEQTPSQEVKPLYLQYAKMEEDYGLLRRALHVYERAVKAVPDCEKSSIYESYINRAESLGFKEVRKIYEQAIEAGLPDSDLKSLCMRLADREASLGEIARARRLYTYTSEYADLQSDSNFWKMWSEFEIMHGNDDTFREMLRIKRTVSLPAQTFERIKRQRLQ